VHKTAFYSKVDHPRMYFFALVGACDLDLDPVTLTYELDLDILKMCPHAESEVSGSRLSQGC